MFKPLFTTILAIMVTLLSGFTNAPLGGLAIDNLINIYNAPTVTTSKNIVSFDEISWSGISQSAFELATKGYQNLQEKGLLKKSNILTVIDFSKSSTQKRLFVLNISTGKVLLSSLVAHGRNSGLEYATSFSNECESNKSSLGFYTTGGTYIGEHGYSLKLNGCERGINDAAYQRAIVVHGAEYVSDDIVRAQGFLGRSLGCPAVPQNTSKKLIDIIKNGSCLFIYQQNNKYINQSKILNC